MWANLARANLLVVVVVCAMGICPTAAQPRIESSDFHYLGAFRTPQGTSGGSRFGYGGHAIAYHAANDSLFITGHDQQEQFVAEISVPAPALADDVRDLPVASVLQPFADVTDGLIHSSETDRIGGLLVDEGKLIFSAYEYYDADTSVHESHGTSGLDLSVGDDATGLYQVGPQNAGMVAGYMTHVPSAWQASFGSTHLTGQANIPITGRTSDGPAIYGFNTADLTGDSETVVAPVVPLASYPWPDSLVPLVNGVQPANELFNRANDVTGVAFPDGSRSVLVFGTHGLGDYCYDNVDGSGAFCDDPARDGKGTHAYPYRYQVWAYDALDLLEVKAGNLAPHEVLPYDYWELELPFAPLAHDLGEVSYDPATQRLFVSQLDVLAHEGLDVYPVIHVFQLSHADLFGDLNGDGFVDGEDLGILLGNFGEDVGPGGGELNGTGPVDGIDLGLLLGAWNPPPEPLAVAPVPEPASAALALTLLGYSLASPRRGKR